MHLLLMIPSSLLLLLLFLHSWHYRGRRATLIFFPACFAFGILRGNTIYHIITDLLGGTSLPYLMVRPVVKIWQASLQECIGWVFALYLSWSAVEWLITRGRSTRVPLFRLIGMASLLMGAVAYAVEAAAAAVKWWVWTIPIRNPYYSDVPFAGIVAWISTGVDFLAVFLILFYGGFKGWWKWLTLLIFPFHMLLHLKVGNMASWAPMNPYELWYWLMIFGLILGIVTGGPKVQTLLEPEQRGKDNPLVKHAIIGTVAGFLLTLLIAQLGLVREPYLLISLVPFLTIVLFIRPLWAAAFCVTSCLIYGLFAGAWSLIIVPLAVMAVFGFSLPPLEGKLQGTWRLRATLAVIGVASVLIYYDYYDRAQRYAGFSSIADALAGETTSAGVARLMEQFPDPPRYEDSFHYNLLGSKLNRLGNYSAAIAVLERGVASDSTYPLLWVNLGWSYMKNGEYDNAVKAYEKTLEMNPVEVDSYVFLGQLYEGRNRAKEAEELYRRGLSYRPAATRLALVLESLLYRQDRMEEAVALLKSCLPGANDSGELSARLAGDLFKLGRNEEAEAQYKEAIRGGVRQISTSALSLAYIYWKDRNDAENALRYVRLAAAVNPVTEVFTMKAAILESMGRNDEAQEAYRQAAQAQAQAEAQSGDR